MKWVKGFLFLIGMVWIAFLEYRILFIYRCLMNLSNQELMQNQINDSFQEQLDGYHQKKKG